MKPEARLDKLVREVLSPFCWAVKIHGHAMQTPGIPDLLLLGRHAVLLELKVGRGDPYFHLRGTQEGAWRRIVRAGTPSFILQTPEYVSPDRLHGATILSGGVRDMYWETTLEEALRIVENTLLHGWPDGIAKSLLTVLGRAT